MIDVTQNMALLGGSSFLLSAIGSLFSNGMRYRHDQIIASLRAASNSFKREIVDVKSARMRKFPFARKLIVITLFPMFFVLLYIVGKDNISVTIPYHHSISFLFGVFKENGYSFKKVTGFVLMLKPIANIWAIISGFYFGMKFKD